MMSTANATKLVGAYVNMRDDLSAQEKRFNEFKKQRKADMQRLADALQRIMDESGGVESLKTPSGTAFKVTKDFVSVTDWDATLVGVLTRALDGVNPQLLDQIVDRIMGSGELSIFNKAVSKAVVKEYMADNEGSIPVGLDYGTKVEIQVRKS